MMSIVNKQTQKIIIGLSGGVDSAVSALLLKQQGYQVEALFMKNWEEDDSTEQNYCSAETDLNDAQAICDQLAIPLHTVNFSHEYWENVFTYFLAEYQAGRTPNPDVLCNKEIKFKVFLEHALNLGANQIATGHYAQITKIDDSYQLQQAVDSKKDQSYFLHAIKATALAKTLFPIGHLTKNQVRNLAKQHHLINANKKDSTGICFIGERPFRQFLKQYLPAQPGDIQTTAGDIIGKHQGLMFYTLGQRQGLGIGGLKHYSEAPWYVLAKQLKTNTLIVTQDKHHPDLNRQQLFTQDIDWINTPPSKFPYHCTAKVRYRQSQSPCTIQLTKDNHYLVNFEQPQWAITPGQSVVFYQQQQCLGGGMITDFEEAG